MNSSARIPRDADAGHAAPQFGIHFAEWLCREAERLSSCVASSNDPLALFILSHVTAWGSGEEDGPSAEECATEEAFCAFIREQTGCEHCVREAGRVWERYLRANRQRMH